VRLLIDDAFATATYTTPIASGWVSGPPEVSVELVPALTAARVSTIDSALLPASELALLQPTHDVVTAVAVIADGVGAIAMRTPVRPDEIESTPVRLFDVSGSAEVLARATLRPFYGIEATSWVRDDHAPEAALAEVVIVEGAEALREPEGGFSEDLARAWFILTAAPTVTHVLLVPREQPAESCQNVTAFLERARGEGFRRRRDWRPALADREAIPRQRASDFWAAQRFLLEDRDRGALLELLRRGLAGKSGSLLSNVKFREGTGST
jgi:predicted solute-binding protein